MGSKDGEEAEFKVFFDGVCLGTLKPLELSEIFICDKVEVDSSKPIEN